MAYGVQSINSNTGNIKYTPCISDADVQTGITQQVETTFFTDFIQVPFSATSPASGCVLYGTAANGGTHTVNSTTDRDLFGANGCIGVLRCSTGTTNNTTGYAGFATAAVLPGFITPTTGFTTKYEIEGNLRTEGTTFSATVPGFIRFGFSSAMTNATPDDGIFFEYSRTNSAGNTAWEIRYYNDTATTTVSTGVTLGTSKTYQFYLYVNKDSSGNYTTQYRVKNITDSTDTGLQTASPSGGNAAYPSDTADVMQFGGTLTKQTTTVTTPIGILFDYFAAKYQLALTRTYINLFG